MRRSRRRSGPHTTGDTRRRGVTALGWPRARVAELADAPDLGSGAFGCAGSSPASRTTAAVLRVDNRARGRLAREMRRECRKGLGMSGRLEPGDTAPDFTLPDDTGTPVTLSDLRGGKVIVYFYPAAMTSGCTKQACDFSDSLESLKAEGYTVLGVSPDKPDKLARFREKEGLTVALLSDADRSVMDAWGAYGEKKLY